MNAIEAGFIKNEKRPNPIRLRNVSSENAFNADPPSMPR
jgi:hypothetical protein